ncbi:hypothetical protein DPMN_186631 [Dreissena polymorpha]|uniref:Uncharacterized protein n=1 Tax=Dreissena polymorpha TaxID=45954 RepID=A0A9D4DMY1_DREPO|nr:hypothetical protein DPMN_186631 [Dreissena polymorpha]
MHKTLLYFISKLTLLILTIVLFQTFFKELEPQKTFFQQVRRAGKFEGTQIPAPQMDNLHQRLTRVCTMAPQRERRLEYEEMKHQLLAFLVASENKLKIWTVKYGHQPNVEALLADYKVRC